MVAAIALAAVYPAIETYFGTSRLRYLGSDSIVVPKDPTLEVSFAFPPPVLVIGGGDIEVHRGQIRVFSGRVITSLHAPDVDRCNEQLMSMPVSGPESIGIVPGTFVCLRTLSNRVVVLRVRSHTAETVDFMVRIYVDPVGIQPK